MAGISTSLNITMRPLPDSPSLQEQRYFPTAEYFARATDTGDATAGEVVFGIQHQNDRLYYVVTEVLFSTNESTASQVIKLRVDPADWEDFNFAGHSAFILMTANMIGSGEFTPDPSQLKLPIYLGKPLKGQDGTLQIIYPTNTDTKLYDVLVRGYAYLQRPAIYNLPKF